MKTLLHRSRDESGQAFVFVAAILTALVGMAALVVDVGSWYQADRRLQTAADAAALAGAQELPLEPSDAKSVAEQYAQHNYAGIPAPIVTFPDAGTIDVVAEADTPGIFAPGPQRRLRGRDGARRGAGQGPRAPRAEGRRSDRRLQGPGVHRLDPSCFGQPVTLDVRRGRPRSTRRRASSASSTWTATAVPAPAT